MRSDAGFSRALINVAPVAGKHATGIESPILIIYDKYNSRARAPMFPSHARAL